MALSASPASIDDTLALLRAHEYVAERSLATALFLALKMERPLFLEGEAGVARPRSRTSSHARSGAAYVKFRQPASRFALVGVFVSEGAGTVRVAVTGAGACVFRAKAMEKRLAENFTPDAIARVKNASNELTSDMHASADYRAHLVRVIAQRAVEAALAGKS